MLGDFGPTQVADHHKNLATTAVAGTYGYIAPESSMIGKLTVKTDVFKFGAVCLEIVCGRKVYDVTYPTDEILLVDDVWRKLSEDAIFSVVDKRLEGEYDLQQVEVVLLLGLLCSHLKPAERPAIHRAVEILAGSVEMPSIPRTKPPAEHYEFSYRDRKKVLVSSRSGTMNANEQDQPNASSSAPNPARSLTRSFQASGGSSTSETLSSRRSYEDAEDRT